MRRPLTLTLPIRREPVRLAGGGLAVTCGRIGVQKSLGFPTERHKYWGTLSSNEKKCQCF